MPASLEMWRYKMTALDSGALDGARPLIQVYSFICRIRCEGKKIKYDARVIPKTVKMVLITSLLGTYY